MFSYNTNEIRIGIEDWSFDGKNTRAGDCFLKNIRLTDGNDEQNINLVNNPGAEVGSMYGWFVSTGWVTAGTGTSAPHSGDFSFLTQSRSVVSLSQNLSLEVGSKYTLSFWASSLDLVSLSLSIAGVNVISLTSMLPTEVWTQYFSSFTANSTIEILQISAATASYINIDDISITYHTTPFPTNPPTNTPSDAPSLAPISLPSLEPMEAPTSELSNGSTEIPTSMPSGAPSSIPISFVLNCAKKGILGKYELIDWNGDNYMDVLCTYYDGTVEYFKGNGSDKLEAGITLTVEGCDTGYMM